MQAGQFHKTYRLSAFNADIESVMSQLEKGLVGMKGKCKRGELLTTDIRLTLVDEAE